MTSPTLAALVTPVGEGGISVIVVRGPEAFAIAEEIFRARSGQKVSQMRSGQLSYGHIVENGQIVDEVVLCVRGPEESATGSPEVEINCHGGIRVSREVLATAVRHGASRASWQEVILNGNASGKLDSIQREAASLLPAAETLAAAAMLADQLQGALSTSISGLISDLGRLRRGEAHAGQLEAAANTIRALLSGADASKALLRRRRIVIAGEPNVGKSTLVNRLLRAPRMITSAEPGTTRDWVSEPASLMGIPIEIVDTPGIRRAAHPVEEMSVMRARAQLEHADLVILMFDNSKGLSSEGKRIIAECRKNFILVINKADLPPGGVGKDLGALLPGRRAIRMSALDGTGVDVLVRAVQEALGVTIREPGSPAVFTQRQENLLREALERIREEAGARQVSSSALEDVIRVLNLVTSGPLSD